MQHLSKVLPWGAITSSSHWTSGARLPVFAKRAVAPANRGSSGSLAIDDLSRAEAQQRRQVGYKPGYAQQQTRRGAGRDRAWNVTTSCAPPSSSGSQAAGRPSRSPAGWPDSAARSIILRKHLSLHLRPDPPHQGLPLAALSAPRQEQTWLPRPEGWIARQTSSKAGFPWQTGRSRRRPHTCGHWEADLMLFAKYGQAILAVHERNSRLLLATRPTSKAAHRVARHLRQSVRSLAQTAASDRHLRQRHRVRPPPHRFTAWPSKPSSVTHTRLGKRAASKMPSDASAASFRAKPTLPPFQPALSAPARRLQQHPTKMP